MMMSKAIILPFFLLAGIASGSQQPQGIVGGSNYYDEDVEGGSLQRKTAPYGYGDHDVAPQQRNAYRYRDDGATYFEDGHEVHSTTTDFYDDYEINNADEEVMDEKSRLQLRGNNNLRLNSNRNGAQCEVGNPFNNCPRRHTCWRRRVGSSWRGNGVCVRNGACLPSNVFLQAFARPNHSLNRIFADMERDCCSGRVWIHIDRSDLHSGTRRRDSHMLLKYVETNILAT